MRNFKNIIFDLDGTLTDTLQDLANSVNYALQACSMPQRSIEEVRQFVGNGVRRLMDQAVPAGTSQENFDKCFAEFKTHYVVHCQDNTRLYPGIEDMLNSLHARGIRTAIVSNKLQSGVDELYHHFFDGKIEVAIGEREGMQRKPAPDMVHLAMLELGITTENTVYVGDSDVDIATARNAGLPCISVLWGFRDRDFLLQHGATTLISHPSELMKFVE